jgi:hypothetical protein
LSNIDSPLAIATIAGKLTTSILVRASIPCSGNAITSFLEIFEVNSAVLGGVIRKIELLSFNASTVSSDNLPFPI